MKKIQATEDHFTPSLFDEIDFLSCRSDSTNAEVLAHEEATLRGTPTLAIAADSNRNVALSANGQK